MNDSKFLTLDNGLTLLIYTDETKVTSHIELVTFLGGFDREFISSKGTTCKIIDGTAHLLEHYVCENTKEGNLLDNLERNKAFGANALTNSERTSYYFDTVINLEKCIKIFLEGIYNVDFSQKGLEKTKYSIYSEIRDAKNDFRRNLSSKKLHLLFDNYCDVLGTCKSLKKIKYKYLKELYEKYYVPKNQFLVVAGNFDEEKILKLIKDIYSKLEFKNNERNNMKLSNKNVVRKSGSMKGNSLNEVLITYKIDVSKLSDFDKYKLDWYLGIFCENNFSRFSKINERLRNKNIINGDITSENYIFGGYEIIEISAYTDNKKEFLDNVFKVISEFGDEEKEDFELCKKAIILRVTVRKDNLSSYVSAIMQNYTDFNYPYDDTIEFLNSLNYDDYKKMIRDIDFTNYSVLNVKSEDKQQKNA